MVRSVVVLALAVRSTIHHGFCKQFPQRTIMENIELRKCLGGGGDDTPFEVLEMLIRLCMLQHSTVDL